MLKLTVTSELNNNVPESFYLYEYERAINTFQQECNEANEIEHDQPMVTLTLDEYDNSEELVAFIEELDSF